MKKQQKILIQVQSDDGLRWIPFTPKLSSQTSDANGTSSDQEGVYDGVMKTEHGAGWNDDQYASNGEQDVLDEGGDAVDEGGDAVDEGDDEARHEAPCEGDEARPALASAVSALYEACQWCVEAGTRQQVAGECLAEVAGTAGTAGPTAPLLTDIHKLLGAGAALQGRIQDKMAALTLHLTGVTPGDLRRGDLPTGGTSLLPTGGLTDITTYQLLREVVQVVSSTTGTPDMGFSPPQYATEEYSHSLLSTKPAGQYKCNYCNRTFRTHRGKLSHELRHTGGKKQLECSICHEELPDQTALTAHIISHASVARQYACGACGKTYRHRASLSYHTHTHHPVGPPTHHCCRYCDKPFTSAQVLKAHVVSVHQSECDKLHECPVCGKRFATRSRHTQHLKYHAPTRPNHCGSCEKTFVSPFDLRRHELTHSGVQPYQCEVCGSTFSQRHSLQGHIASAHGV